MLIAEKGVEEFKIFVLERPFEFFKITLKRISIFWSFARPTGFWPGFSNMQKAATAVFSAIYSVIIFTLGIGGIWLAFKELNPKNRTALKNILAAALSVPLGIIFIVVETRYRYPIYPFLAVFGGYAWHSLFNNFSKTSKILFIVFFLLLLNASVDILRNLDLIFGRLYLYFL